MKPKSQTDCERVKFEAESDAFILWDEESELYNPNDEKAVDEFWKTAIIRKPIFTQEQIESALASAPEKAIIDDEFHVTDWNNAIASYSLDELRNKLIKSEQSGFVTQTKEEILNEFKERLKQDGEL